MGEWAIIGTMRLIMDDRQVSTIQEVKRFLGGNHAVELEAVSGEERYKWIEDVLVRFQYRRLRGAEKGVVRQYIGKVTGYSRAQVSRLIGKYVRQGELRRTEYRRHRFPGKYSRRDMELLARTDELHDYMSGPATKKILEREFLWYGHHEYENISRVSVAHLYNLRKKNIRLGLTRTFTKTRPAVVTIGERAKPDPKGEPGHIRIDTVPQGDGDGRKGVYHVNAVDEVTQWEIVASVEQISEVYLVPVLEVILSGFPFVVRGFHSDNGSEFVNRVVAGLLNKLFIRFTKSRPRHSNDNALGESKNGSVLRKHLGYGYIPQAYAAQLNLYHVQFLNPYINFHRPCFFPVLVTDAKGRVRRKYPYQEVMTPHERLWSLPGVEKYLAPGITIAKLDAIAHHMSDNEFAERMVKARSDLFPRMASALDRVDPVTLHRAPGTTVPRAQGRARSSVKKDPPITTSSGSFFD